MEKFIKEIEFGLGSQVKSYSPIGNGQCNNIYKIDTETTIYCLKTSKNDRLLEELNSLYVEGNILSHLNEKGVRIVPKISLISKEYYIYEYIEGGLMDTIFPSLTEDEKISTCHKIASFHYSLTKINKDNALPLGIGEYEAEKNTLDPDQYDVSELKRDEIRLIKKAHKIYTESLHVSMSQLIHNDAHDKNILINESDVIFIDFGDMLWRDVHYEFYRYVYDYPFYWELIVSDYENLSGRTLDKNRIIAISLLRHLRALLGNDDLKGIISSKLDYYKKLFKSIA